MSYIFPNVRGKNELTRSYRYNEDDKLEYFMNFQGAVITEYWERPSMESMLDPNRLNRNHILTVRNKDGKFVVVLTDKDEKDTWEISWDKWVREGRKALED